MITRRTKVQLLIFVIITLLGVSYVGARYARLDRVIRDDSYTVVAHYPDSGGIFAGAEVTYRGVGIGIVDKLVLTDAGVDVHLSIDNKWDKIPKDTLAVVGNRSAVGEQYVELQPKVDDGPFLKENSEIAEANTTIPIQTPKLLADVAATVSSVDEQDLRTTVSELSAAFAGTGEDLQTIIDTSNSFIEVANQNFDITSALIRDANTVLTGQIDSESAIRNFATQLAGFSNTLVASDGDLRKVIDSGSFTANQLRTFLEQNQVELGSLIRNLVTTSEIVVKHLDGLEHVLVIYPYVMEGAFTVASRSPDTGLSDAHFGLVITAEEPCREGYTPNSDQRTPSDGSNRPMNTKAGCTEPITMSNPRGPQNLPRAAANYRAPVVADYDRGTGKLTWAKQGAQTAGLVDSSTLTEAEKRKESWKWLYLQPLMAQ